MRIALVVERFEPSGGGVEQAVWNVAHALAEAGDDVHVIARKLADSPCVSARPVRVPTFWQPLRVLRFSQAAGAAASAGRYDVVHSFCRTRHQDLFNAGGGSHADYMLSAYGELGTALRRVSPRHALQLAMERRIFADPRQLIQCVSELVRDQIAGRFGVPDDRLAVVHNGVDAQRFEPERHRDAGRALRREQGAEERSVWLFAGSGWRRKGLDTALDALARCEDDSALLWVAGNDDVRTWQRRAGALGLAARVRFLGARSDMERVYAAADALILPTRYDAFALVALEAGAAGLPVVISAAAGAAELLGEAAIVIEDPEDASAFAQAMTRLSAPGLRASLGEAGRKVAAQHDWHEHAAKLRTLYQRVRSS